MKMTWLLICIIGGWAVLAMLAISLVVAGARADRRLRKGRE